MRPRTLVGALILSILVTFSGQVEAAPLHHFDCKLCHTPGLSLASLGQGTTNLCLSCHKPTPPQVAFLDERGVRAAGSHFVVDDASDAMGTVSALIQRAPVEQTSHNWFNPTDVVAAAGAKAAPKTLYYSRYNISGGKITCSKCHNPHGAIDESNPAILRLSTYFPTADSLCLGCHVDFNKGTGDNAHLTHPLMADYATFQAANSDNYKAFDNTVGQLALVNGGISCTTCHGTHATDSDSSTVDGFGVTINKGDGKLLRADGRGGDSSQLCQACHTYGKHGSGTTIGCLDCHSGHSYNDGNPNYYILRRDIPQVLSKKTGALSDITDLDYTTINAQWMNSAGTGYCQQCHTLTGSHNGMTEGGVAECRDCHNHQNSSGSFVGSCNACHGYAPDQNVAGGPRGYAVDPDSGVKYTDPEKGFRDESTTAHKSHANKLGVGASPAGDYTYDCQNCHGDFLSGSPPPHRDGNFQDVPFGELAKKGMSPLPSYSQTGDGSCANVYCHSNGGKRTGDASRFYKPVTSGLSWVIGSNGISSCAACHGNDQATMAESARDNSVSHFKHLAKYANDCGLCHRATAVSNTELAPLAIGGTHVNGVVDVLMHNGGYDPADGTCSTNCHSDGRGNLSVPDWDVAASGACGTCHKVDTVGNQIASGSHSAHINDTIKNRIGRNLGCIECHSNTVNEANLISNESNHVNGVFNLGIKLDAGKTSCDNISCHSNGNYDGNLVYKSVGTDFPWGGGALSGCDACHGDGAGRAYPSYANGGIGVNANSHAAHISSGISCETCHSGTATGNALKTGGTALHVNRQIDVSFTQPGASYAGGVCSNVDCHGGNNVSWGQTNLSCSSCHLGSGADVDSFVWGDGKTALINSAEWTYSGHGKTSGTYEVTGRAAANFTGDACAYCHDNAIGHNQDNYFRLRSNGFADLNGNCLACHGSGSAGVNGKNATVKIDKYHGGAKHSVDSDAGRWCWDCHDPHGDASAAGQRIQMIQRRAAVNPNEFGVPTGLTGTDIVFYDRTLGIGAGAFARDAEPFAAGVCNACHTSTSYYKFNAGKGSHSPNQCTSCHQHSGDATYNGGGFKASCNGCHGGNFTGTTSGRKNMWPDDVSAEAQAPNRAGAHQLHILEIAQRLDASYGTVDAILNNMTDEQQKMLCEYCHAAVLNDKDHGQAGSAEVFVTTMPDDSEARFAKKIWDGTTDTGATYNAPDCTVACHFNKATNSDGGNFGWYSGSSSACIMCHKDVPADTKSHTIHTGNNWKIGCNQCHLGNPIWVNAATTAAPTVGHIDGTLLVQSDQRTFTYDPVSGSCGVNECHNDGTNNLAKVAGYGWHAGKTAGMCGACHGYPVVTNNHYAHVVAHLDPVRFVDTAIECLACHTNLGYFGGESADHFDGSISFNAGMGYSGTTAITDGGSYGTCTTLVCHNNGRGTAVPTPLWNRTPQSSDDCSICHAGVPASGSHGQHVATAPTTYGATGNNSTAANYNYACGECHGTALSNHIKGSTSMNPQIGYAGQQCTSSYCHSTGASTTSPVYVASPAWGTTPAGDGCAICHANSPDSGAHSAHAVGIHYDGIYTGGSGLLPVASAHGDTNSTTISCNLCHSQTISSSWNSQSAACVGCHAGGIKAVIANKAKHVDGTVDVVFQDVLVKSKAQLRDDITSASELNDTWTRVDGYKNANSYDQAKLSLAAATFVGNSCITVSCHNGIEATWTAPQNDCTSCHTQLP